MNEQLKFSWGHIIAFLALIIISYISFVGVKNNNFNKFFDVLKEYDFVMAEDYKIVLQAQVDYLVESDPSIKNNDTPLFTIPVNLEEKTFIVNMDEEAATIRTPKIRLINIL
jgi:hypothetical protein